MKPLPTTSYFPLNTQPIIGVRYMEIDRINKYCHVSAYIAYDNCSPVYKQTFKFEISPSDHNSIVWDKIIKTLKKIGINVELKS